MSKQLKHAAADLGLYSTNNNNNLFSSVWFGLPFALDPVPALCFVHQLFCCRRFIAVLWSI